MWAAIAMCAVSVFLSLCILVPAPTVGLLPFTVATPELAHWVLLIDVVSLILAIVFCRRATLFAAASLAAALWPVVSALRMGAPLAAMYRPMESPAVQAQSLPHSILYYRSAGESVLPVVVEIYGGAWQRGAPERDEVLSRYLAGRGYAVFAIDYRHAPRFTFPAQIEDVRAALGFIYANARRYNADPERIALLGRSAGGQLALLAAYENGPVPIRGVISLYGPTNLARGYAELPSPDPIDVRLTLATYLGGTPAQAAERYAAASPYTYAGHHVPPTLLIQGGRDHVVKPEFARALYERLRASGNRAALVEIPWAEHSFDEVPTGLGTRIALGRVEEFLAAVSGKGGQLDDLVERDGFKRKPGLLPGAQAARDH